MKTLWIPLRLSAALTLFALLSLSTQAQSLGQLDADTYKPGMTELSPTEVSSNALSTASAVPQRGSDIVEFNNINFTVNPDFTGGAVEWTTGNVCACDTSPFNFNIWTPGSGNASFFWPIQDTAGGISMDGGITYAVLEEGDTIGPGGDFIMISSDAATTHWRAAGGVTGYLGFQFINTSTSIVNYGYVRIEMNGTTGHPATILGWAYNQAGDPITIGGGGGGEVITMAEARDLGPGTTVTVEGVVSRAMGAFSYFQDDTAGLSLRETSGPFFDAVAAGDVTEGTRVLVTGTLSEFNGLIQINQGEMDSFEILGQGEDVVAQEVSLDDLGDFAYQAELVRITGLSFVDASGEFAAGTSYNVADEGGNTIELRIPNATDTEMVGLPIPENQFTFTGVVGAFNAPQLMAIFEGDVDKSSSNEGSGSNLAFELFPNYPNPFSGQTTISFELPVASHVTVEVLDVTGRRVALLVDEHMGAAPHSVEWNADGFANGVYFYRMVADGFSKTLRTTLVR